MWNYSHHWQRHARLIAGAAVLVLLVSSGIALERTSPARRTLAGVGDLVRELRASAKRTVDVAVPAGLGTRPGALVYLEKAEGFAQVIGRVIAVEAGDQDQVRLGIRLMGPIASSASTGGVLKGAPASLDLRDAVRLLISPDTPNEEALLARDAIWPSVQASVMPGMIDGLIAEISKDLTVLDQQDRALLAKSMEQLRDALKPLEEELINRLAVRSWEIVGAKGLAQGIWRTTAGSIQNKSRALVDLWWQLFSEQTTSPTASRPFFSEEMNLALQSALEEETLAFWKEHQAAIIDAMRRVIDQDRPEFETAFRERWASILYERAMVPAWLAGQDKVLAAVQEYANDFAARRLLTNKGGPRLLFAHALRSSLGISDAPLLVFAPGKQGNIDPIRFEPYLH
jgi:hypothetical protein